MTPHLLHCIAAGLGVLGALSLYGAKLTFSLPWLEPVRATLSGCWLALLLLGSGSLILAAALGMA